jgi:predicted deacylase
MRARIRIPLGDQAVWVAAQELIMPSIYDVWLRKMDQTTAASVQELGRSRAGLPIYKLESSPDSKDVILLIGRQHPPEVSGTFAFISFAETLLSETELAMAFRERYRIVGVPLLNPDGVVGGNWRHNLDGTDLNRDWGLFEQPETRLIGDLFDQYDAAGDQLRAFVDFHSTADNIFYAQLADDVTNPPNFIIDLLAAAEPRLVDYPFSNVPSPTTNTTVSKNYVYLRYGIPAFTYEVGDETDRAAVAAAAVVIAEEFMKLLLRQ